MDGKKRKVSRRALLTSLPVVLSSGSCNGKEEESLSSVNFTSEGITDEELTVVSAETQLPVPGAKVWGPFQSDFITDGQGRVVVRVGEEYPLGINADGYLKRETRFRRDRKTISLWPITAQEDVYFNELLYFKGELRSVRAPFFTLAFKPESDADVVASHRAAARQIEEVLGGRIRFATGPQNGSGAEFSVAIDPSRKEFAQNPQWGGFTLVTAVQGVIAKAEMFYRNVDSAIRLSAHELGHCFGLGHASSRGPWRMHPSDYYLADNFHPTEQRALKFSIIREPRWLPLDNDRDRSLVVSAAVQPEAYIVGC